MLCFSVNIRKFKVITLIILVCILVIGVTFIVNKDEDNKIILDDSLKRIEFLASNGYIADESSCVASEEVIPHEFSLVYDEYNSLQLQQGFDLSDFKGLNVEIYTYDIGNDMVAVLIIHKNILIGCDIHSSVYGGECGVLMN